MNSANLSQRKLQRYLPGPAIINRYWIAGTLTTLSPLHIGTGETGSNWKLDEEKSADDSRKQKGKHRCNYVTLADRGPNGILPRDSAKGRPQAHPILPGTSLRGVLRSWLEGLLFPFNSKGKYDVASLSAAAEIERGLTRDDLDAYRKTLLDPQKSPLQPIPKDPLEREHAVEQKMAEYVREQSDLVGFLFGSTLVRSRVSFGHAVGARDQNDPKKLGALFDVRTGVSIDRDTGAAADDKLFDIEVVRPGTKFAIDIRFTNVRYWEIGLVLAALDVFNHPIFPLQVGAHTQHEYGKMNWKLTEVYQLGHDSIGHSPALKDWIGGTDKNGNPKEALAIAKRNLKDTKGQPITTVDAFRDLCIAGLQEVLDDVCA